MTVTLEQALQLALVQFQAGQLVAAEAIYRQILAIQPQHADSLHMLGSIAYASGRYDDAAKFFAQAIAQAPDRAAFHCDLGAVLSRLGRLEDAVASLQRAAALNPKVPDTFLNLGSVLCDLGRFDEAIANCQRVLELRPGDADACHNFGNAFSGKSQWDQAAASYQQAVSLRPDFPEAHLNLGNVFWEMKRRDEAVACFQRALRVQPDYAEAHNNLGNAFSEMGRLDEALASIQRAVALKPNYPEAFNNLGNTLCKTGRFEEAIRFFQHAIALKPGYADASNNLGVTLRNLGRVEGALRCYRQAIEWRPDFVAAHWNIGCSLLLLGQYEEGWREYEWRRQSTSLSLPRRTFSRPQWDGAPVPGQTILLHAEQGLGDTVLFLRYVPLVRERAQAARVIVDCPQELARLVAATGGWDADIVARQSLDEASLPAFDCHLALPSLPLMLGLFEPQRVAGPYLHADSTLCAAWRERISRDATLRVGLAWAGNPTHTNDHYRSIAIERILPLLRTPGVTFYPLQFALDHEQSQRLADAGARELTAEITDFADTAALMAELDLVVSVDTSVVHLAGALGRPVWTLLAFAPDWRWGLEREDTPWYPTMRLFRQPALGDWDSVLQRVAAELAAATR